MMERSTHRQPLGVKVRTHFLRCMNVNADGYIHRCSVCLQKFYSVTDAETTLCLKTRQ